MEPEKHKAKDLRSTRGVSVVVDKRWRVWTHTHTHSTHPHICAMLLSLRERGPRRHAVVSTQLGTRRMGHAASSVWISSTTLYLSVACLCPPHHAWPARHGAAGGGGRAQGHICMHSGLPRGSLSCATRQRLFRLESSTHDTHPHSICSLLPLFLFSAHRHPPSLSLTLGCGWLSLCHPHGYLPRRARHCRQEQLMLPSFPLCFPVSSSRAHLHPE